MLAPLSYFEANDVFSLYPLLQNCWWQKRVQTVSLSAVEVLIFFGLFFLFPSGLPSSPHRGVFPLSSTFHRVLGINASFSQTSHSSSGTPEAIPSLKHFPDPQMKLAAPVRAHGTGVPAYNNYF